MDDILRCYQAEVEKKAEVTVVGHHRIHLASEEGVSNGEMTHWTKAVQYHHCRK